MVRRIGGILFRTILFRVWAWAALAVAVGAARQPSACAQPHEDGVWGPVVSWPNVPIHASLLPNGKVLFWGRRELGSSNLDPIVCTPRIWDPEEADPDEAFEPTAELPGINLFCAGHAFMADGKLFVAGGHKGADGKGEDVALIYDYEDDEWDQLGPRMKGGRWYPSATTLPDGSILVSFGTIDNNHDNPTQEIWKNGSWKEIVDFRFPGGNPRVPPYYPRMHVAPDGKVFMTGPLALTQFLEPDFDNGTGQLPGRWTLLRPDLGIPGSERANLAREYGASVMYDAGKVMYIGGGNPPTAACEFVDLNAGDRRWRPAGTMTLARRQHNATLLPDGKILVTGGTKGDGDGNNDHTANEPIPQGPGTTFNDLRTGQPLRSAEWWDPATNAWTRLAMAARDRCYHSISLLLPDGRVLSAGGGEYRPYDAWGNGRANHPQDTHANGQIFSPPYLFRSDGSAADRPQMTNGPEEVSYGQEFTVDSPDAGAIGKVSWIKLGSATHSYDSGQRLLFLTFTPDGAGRLKIRAPANSKLAPPGHYMLFLVNQAGTPSISRMIRIH